TNALEAACVGCNSITSSATRWTLWGGTSTNVSTNYTFPSGLSLQTYWWSNWALSPQIQADFNVANSAGCYYFRPSSIHTAVPRAGLGDGSVRSISSGMSPTTLNLAMVPNDKQPMPSDW